jgi:hypothetical protein
MPENVALLHRRHEAVIEVEVRAADGGGSHSNDRVAWIDDPRIGNVVHPDVMRSVVHDGFHWSPWL